MKKRKTFGEVLALPQETYSDQPLTQVRGRRSAVVENHNGILEYTDERVKIAVKRGSVCVIGAGLHIAQMTRSRVEIRGSIQRLELE